MAEIMTKIKKWIESSSKKQKLVVSLFAFGLLATGALLSFGDASSVAKDPLSSTPFYFLSAFVKLMAVLLLIVGSSVIFRRWLQPGLNGKTARQMHLLETIRLSPKQALHLIVIGDQKLLIGATDQNVSLIAPVDDNLVPASSKESQPQPGLDFGSMIRSFNFSSENRQEKE
jgi:flagellar biosynthetic protein FliO